MGRRKLGPRVPRKTVPRIDWGPECGFITWRDTGTDEDRAGQIWSPAPSGGLWVIPCSPRDPHEVEYVVKRESGYITGPRCQDRRSA
jgi:hypothetical protein